jgi:hypothetical protein
MSPCGFRIHPEQLQHDVPFLSFTATLPVPQMPAAGKADAAVAASVPATKVFCIRKSPSGGHYSRLGTGWQKDFQLLSSASQRQP